MPAAVRHFRTDIKPPVYYPNTSTAINYSSNSSRNNFNQITSPITSDTLSPPPTPFPRHKAPNLKRARTFHDFGPFARDHQREVVPERGRERERDRQALRQRRHTTRRFSSRAPAPLDFLSRRSSPDESFDEGLIINDRWKLQRKLGSGAFAQVYEAVDIHHGNVVAVKLERAGGKTLLDRESDIYDTIYDHGGVDGRVPRKYYFKKERAFSVLVMDCLGPSLGQQLKRKPRRRFSTQSVLQIAIQGIKCLQALHRTGVVHRDVKPDNMVVGREGDRRLYLVDFGLAARYMDWKGRHVPRSKRQGAVGTVDFASVNSMQGLKISRRDDLMSLGYSLVYLHQGSLPWSKVRGRTMSELQERVCEKKRKIKLTRLCGSMPHEFVDYFRDVEKLAYNATPDYRQLIRRFKGVMRKRRYSEDNVFEWTSSSSGERAR